MSNELAWNIFFISPFFYAVHMLLLSSAEPGERSFKSKLLTSLIRGWSIVGMALSILLIYKGYCLLAFENYYDGVKWQGLFDYTGVEPTNGSARARKHMILMPFLSVLIAVFPFAVLAYGCWGACIYFGSLRDSIRTQ